MNDGYIVITGDFYGMRNILCLWGDLLVLIIGITRAITVCDCAMKIVIQEGI